MRDDFSLCMVSNTRMAARAITRRYDAFARPFGITSTQFSVMGLIVASGERNVSELAEARGFERTTLTRNLDRLQKMGLIASQPADHGNGRICSLTDKGRTLVDEMLPRWRQAQADVRAELGLDDFSDTINTLQRIAAL
ncbi:MAG: winged helix-turn-helix transcriptional regulator [Devosia sp.]|uniref:MarR family winged helix-turn-helix transcriptional regulator n=1 Tax=Devosia sp. TaxID=1871048 RepID=UPI001AD02895|nr:MarR family winged helix-turn-helix transcriptional regulator [Devosia sp.]MBN9316074.1 winged helix-turn-helix transcriptional regulator [Devosia sp.]